MQVHDLNGFGCQEAPLAICAAGCLLHYVKKTQKANLPHIRSIHVENREERLLLDGLSQRHLELFTNLSGGVENTLISVLDQTQTSMGSRLLKRWLHSPLRDHPVLRERQDSVQAFLMHHAYLPLQKIFHEMTDLERILSRIALKSARPRDLIALRMTLQLLPAFKQQLQFFTTPLLERLKNAIQEFKALCDLLFSAIVEEPPLHLRDGGVIARGYDAELDELLALSENAGDYLIALEEQEKKRTGLSTLKVGYNRVHGYYIEISRLQAEQAPLDYVRRQTLKNAERFITPELKAFEDKALSAKDRALAREKFLYDALLQQLIPYIPELQACASALSELDVLANFAERAARFHWCCPLFSQESGLHILEGRHPVVECVSKQAFVPNDILLNDHERLLMITGPNMGGKSTYMRQVALIILLAHIGSFIPAKEASIGPIDRIFTRIGASDDLAGGRSTFMVEMTETAHILHHATVNSLVLMDEVGRGTSTTDGLSLAYACAHDLATRIRSFTLFATHYFELTTLAEETTGIKNIHFGATEHHDQLVFLHAVQPGPASQSYGIHVAQLAGIPRSVIQLAKQKLKMLEGQTSVNQFISENQPHREVTEHPVLLQLQAIHPDQLTPKEALELLYRLKKDVF